MPRGSMMAVNRQALPPQIDGNLDLPGVLRRIVTEVAPREHYTAARLETIWLSHRISKPGFKSVHQ